MVLDQNDVILEILLRLPLKSLLKFKCMSKLWYNLISDPVFIADYSRRNPQYHISGFYLQKFFYLKQHPDFVFLTCEGETEAAPQPSLAFIEDENGVCILHSCSGLLLCCSFRGTEDEKKYYICQPATKQYRSLPKPRYKKVFGMNIAFDPENPVRYKVICICDSDFSPSHYELKIYSSKQGSWRVSGYPFIVQDDIVFDRGAFWNGSLHWFSKGLTSCRFDVNRELLLAFPMPPIKDGWEQRRVSYFGESGGHLYLIEFYGYGRQTKTFEVLELISDYSGWFVKYNVNLQYLPHHLFSVLHIGHRKVEEKEEAFMVVHIPGKLFKHNLEEGNRLVDEMPNDKIPDEALGLCYTWDKVYPYTNTLLCL